MNREKAASAAGKLQTQIAYPDWLRGITVEGAPRGYIVVLLVEDGVTLPPIPRQIDSVPIEVRRESGDTVAGG